MGTRSSIDVYCTHFLRNLDISWSLAHTMSDNNVEIGTVRCVIRQSGGTVVENHANRVVLTQNVYLPLYCTNVPPLKDDSQPHTLDHTLS